MVSERLRFNIETYEAPRTLYHGDPAQLKLVGWILSEPQVREVHIRLSEREAIVGCCDVARSDVLEAHEEFTNALCGFEVASSLDFLAPGIYKIELSAPGTSLSAELDDIHVLPRCEFELQRCFVPDAASRRRNLPISIQGTLKSSCPLRKVEVFWDSQETDIEPDFVGEVAEESGLLSYQVSLFDEVSLSVSSSQVVIELVFHTQGHGLYRWKHRSSIRLTDAPPHSLSLREISGYNPKTGLVSVCFKGVVLNEDDASIVLMREGERLMVEPLDGFPVQHSLVWFDISRDLATIPPGTWGFTIVLERSTGGPSHVLSHWRHQVEMVEPRLNIEYYDVRLPGPRKSGCIVGVVGWVENHFAVDELLLKVGGEKPVAVALDQLRRDVAEHLGQRLVRRQGFHADVFFDIAPGEYSVQILFAQQGRLAVLWEEVVLIEDRSSPGVVIESAQLADLADEDSCNFWSSIRFEGEIDSGSNDIVAVLWVDGQEVDRQIIGARRSFFLRYIPVSSGCYQVRVLLASREDSFYDSGLRYVLFEEFEVPSYAISIVERFVRRFKLEEYFDGCSVSELARSLLEGDRRLVSCYLAMFREIDSALGVSAQRHAKVGRSPSVDQKSVQSSRVCSEEPLKILFVCWEIPCPRHGGGVWLSNMLKCLARKHEITLVHSYGIDEEDWLDEVRQHVMRVISVPRLSNAAACPEDDLMLGRVREDYVPLLRSAVAMEVETGHYDVVNYDYSKLYLHSAEANLPQILVVHEERLLTGLASCAQEREPDFVARARRLDDLLKEFYFSTVKLPRKFRHLVALTEEDASALGEFQRISEVRVNHIGVDVEGLRRPADAGSSQEGESPTLAFLGNYRHPPNVAAVRFFADKVMPEVLRRCPEVRFNAVGSHVPEELESDFQASDNVVFTGFVEDFRPYLWSASAFVAPIFLGAGMRVKILEAMACGVPVIGTALSMHGIEAIDGEHYFHAETESQFTEMSIRCIEEPEEAMRVGRQGAELIARKYSYEISAQEREAIWYRAIEDWERRFGGENRDQI